MNCKKCGNQLNPGDMFCMSCGERVEPLNNSGVSQQPANVGVVQPTGPVSGQVPVTNGATSVEQPASTSPELTVTSQPVQSVPTMQSSAQSVQSTLQPTSQQTATPEIQPVTNSNAATVAPVEAATSVVGSTPQQSTVGATAVSMPAPTQKKPTGKFDINKDNMIYIIIIAVLAVAVIGLLAYIVFGGNGEKCEPAGNKTNQNIAGDNNNNNNNNNNDDNNAGNTGNEQDDNQGNNENNQSNTNANTLLIGDYEFTVPSGFVFTLDADNTAFIGDTANTMRIMMGVENVRYSELYAKIEEVKTSLVAQGMTIVNTRYQTLSGVSYILIDGVLADQSLTYYIAEINTSDVAVGLMAVKPGQLFDPVLNALVSIISTKRYLGTGSNNTTSFYVPLPGVTPQEFSNQLK